MKYGPWIAFNEGDTPPANGGLVQTQLACETRNQVETNLENIAKASDWLWDTSPLAPHRRIIAYRVAYHVMMQPVRGEVVYDGTLRTYYSLHAGTSAKCYDTFDDHVHLTFTTADDLLIPGTYTGPDGATIKIELVK